jgi:hypothetical protein
LSYIYETLRQMYPIMNHVWTLVNATDQWPQRVAREFGQMATLWAHWSVAFAHCLLISSAFPVTLILVEF